MPGRYLYVPNRDIFAVDLRLMKIPAFGGSCPRANMDERRDLIKAHISAFGQCAKS